MNAVKIAVAPAIPDFKFPEQYKPDIWDFKNWDYYKDSSEEHRHEWNQRGNYYKTDIDFSICENKYLREEIKYFLYYLVEESGISLSTFARRWQQCRVIIRFANKYLNNYYSFTEFNDFELYKRFLSEEEDIPKELTKKAKKVITKDLESHESIQDCDFVRIIRQISTVLNDFFDDRPEMERDIWRVDKLPFNIRNSQTQPIRTINFSRIAQPQIKKAVQHYVKIRLNSLSMVSIVNGVNAMTNLSVWLDENHPEIKSLCDMDRAIMEEYIKWIKTKSGFNSQNAARYLGAINTVFDYLRLTRKNFVPNKKIIDNIDYKTKLKLEPKPYSQDEMKRINQLLNYVDDLQYARIVFLLEVTGCRLSEILLLKPEQLKTMGTSYSLKVIRGKTNKIHRIPIEEMTKEIIEQGYKESQKRYGKDTVYVFAKDAKSNMLRSELDKHLTELAFKHQLKDDSGKPFKIGFKRFRTTLACKYLEIGLDADIISLMLGHKVKGTLKSYAAVSKKELKEAMKPRLDKFNMLIENIGQTENLRVMPVNHAGQIPLPNGYCSKNVATGVCEHANYCLTCTMFCPDEKYLLGYKLQLREVEKAILDAEEKENERLLEINLKTKEALISIIERLEGNNHGEEL